MAAKPVTIYDIANASGYSFSTVSAALRGDPKVAPKTRQTVVAHADKMGYQRNLFAAQLAAQRRKPTEHKSTIPLALLLPQNCTALQKERVEEIKLFANELGYQIQCYHPELWPSARVAERTLYNRGVAGVIYLSNWMRSLPPQLDLSRYTVVKIGREFPQLPVHSVWSNSFQTVTFAWSKATQLGHTRIGAAILKHNPVAFEDHLRLGAVLAMQHGMAEPEIIPPLLVEWQDERGLLAWYRQYRPTTILAMNLNAYRVLENAGHKIPDEVSFVSLNLRHNLTAWHGAVTGIKDHVSEQFRVALSLLDTKLRHGEKGIPEKPEIIEVSLSWHEGQSLARLHTS